jgi:hypothetical protein
MYSQLQKINKKALGIFTSIYILLLVVISFSLNSSFEEDEIYINHARSMAQDLDYNILNQVNSDFGWMLTKHYVHPSQHSVIQTPSLFFLEFINKSISKFFEKISIREFIIPTILLNIFSLYFGLFFCRRTLNLIGKDITNPQFCFFVASSALFYYSFMSLSVIEVFCFPLSSYLMYTIFQITETSEKDFNPLVLGLASGILITSKVSYIFLFILSLYLMCSSNLEDKRKKVICFVSGVLLIVVPSFINEFVQYGQIAFINSALSVIMLDVSLYNFYNTLIFGYFGKGGMFYVNPVYLPIFFIIISYFLKEILYLRKNIIRNLLFLLWFGMGFFQTIFLPAFVVSDHYIGRLVLTCLPLIVVGFGLLVSKFKEKKYTIYLSSIVLVFWQIFTMFNFLSFYTKGHYDYATKKIVDSSSEFFETIFVLLNGSFNHFVNNWSYILLFTLVAAFFTYWLKTKNKGDFFNKYIVFISIGLGIFSLLNLANSKKNTEKFFSKPENRFQRVIANDPKLYLFIYVMDGLKTLYLNTEDPHMKKVIDTKRKNYFDSIKNMTIKSTPEFDKAIREYDYEFGYFK